MRGLIIGLLLSGICTLLLGSRQFYDESIPGLRLNDYPQAPTPGKVFYDDGVDYPLGPSDELFDAPYEHYQCDLEDCENI